jgi:hypothetical protein
MSTSDFEEVMESVWETERSIAEVRQDLLKRGFEENAIFHQLINEDFE